MKKWRKKIFFSIVILLTIWLLWGNYSVDINHISVSKLIYTKIFMQI